MDIQLTNNPNTFFPGYRRIFTVVFFLNLAVFIVFIARNHGSPRIADVGNAASANFTVTILFRQENFVNLLYDIATCVPHSTPLYIRRRLALVFHYGAHSGAGVAAVTWYILYTALATKEFAQTRRRDQIPNVVTSYIPIVMFGAILGGAHPPRFRVRYHDRFEVMHRFASWTALVTFWVHTVTAARVYAKDESTTLGLYIVQSPNFWTFLISTICYHGYAFADTTCTPRFSPTTLLDFMTMPPFYGIKISDHPLMEWHVFATIPDDDGSGPKGFSVVVSTAGDWTKRTIKEPPKKLWVWGRLYTACCFVPVYSKKSSSWLQVPALGPACRSSTPISPRGASFGLPHIPKPPTDQKSYYDGTTF